MSYKIQFKVRDYECDLQGIVNNAVYLNYLEHARHEFLLSKGIDFAHLAKIKIYPVVYRAELDYKTPLTSGNEFFVSVSLDKVSKLKYQFKQQIVRAEDDTLILNAKIFTVILNERRKPYSPDIINKLLTD